jgi:hypothetical protein
MLITAQPAYQTGPQVDETWYLQKYPDIAAAVQHKRMSSARDHFHLTGAAEEAKPNAELQDEALHGRSTVKSA